MEKKLTPNSTKAEIFEAYNELAAQVQNSKNEEPKAIKEKEEKKVVVKTASENNEENIVKSIADLKLSLNSSLDKTVDALLKEYKRLSLIQDAISIEQKRLEELYQINAETDTLATILSVQKQKKEQFEKEIAEKKQLTENDIQTKLHNFTEEIAGKKTNWEKEQKEHETSVKERDILLQKDRKREEEEFIYNQKLTRKKEQDAYLQQKAEQEKQLNEQKTTTEKLLNEQKAAIEKEITERRQAFEKEIEQREQNVAAREQELAELRKKTEAFPTELQKTVETAEKQIAEKLKMRYEFDIQLKGKETEGELKLREQTIVTLQNKIKDLELLNKQLSVKADGAEGNVKEIAIRAIESSSNIRLFEKEKLVKEDNK